jgi:hypothetical protein
MSALDDIEARLAAANSAADLHDPTYDGLTEHGGYSVRMGQGVSTDGYLPEEVAELIAHAPADLAALVRVVKIVEAMHREIAGPDDATTCFTCIELDHSEGETPWDYTYPCPTTEALAAMTGGAS